MNAVPTCALHKGRRDKQEDQVAFSAFDNTEFVAHAGIAGVVADGIGGVQYGYESAKAAIQAFLSGYHQKTPDESIPDALDRSLKAANQAVRALGAQMGDERSVGTTLTAAVLWQDQFYWVSTGDSAVLRCSNGTAKRYTASHEIGSTGSIESFLGLPLENLQIDRNTAPVPLQPNDALVVCTDGLYKWLSEKTIAEVCASAPPAELADQLLGSTLSLDLESQDNIAVAAMVYTGAQARTGVVFTGGRRASRRRALMWAVPLALVVLAGAAAAYYWFVLKPAESRRAASRHTIAQIEQAYSAADCAKVAALAPKVDRSAGVDLQSIDRAVAACNAVADALKTAQESVAQADGAMQKAQAAPDAAQQAKLRAEAKTKYEEAATILSKAQAQLPNQSAEIKKLQAEVADKQQKVPPPAVAPAAGRNTRAAKPEPPKPKVSFDNKDKK